MQNHTRAAATAAAAAAARLLVCIVMQSFSHWSQLEPYFCSLQDGHSVVHAKLQLDILKMDMLLIPKILISVSFEASVKQYVMPT